LSTSSFVVTSCPTPSPVVYEATDPDGWYVTFETAGTPLTRTPTGMPET
jgi:hypothetical protein